MGRRKIDIIPIADDRTRQTTFIKRKLGLIKKAYELSVLCNCEIALIVFSSNNKLFQYASENMDKVLLRYTGYEQPHGEIITNATIKEQENRKKLGKGGIKRKDNDSSDSDSESSGFVIRKRHTPEDLTKYEKINHEFNILMLSHLQSMVPASNANQTGMQFALPPGCTLVPVKSSSSDIQTVNQPGYCSLVDVCDEEMVKTSVEQKPINLMSTSQQRGTMATTCGNQLLSGNLKIEIPNNSPINLMPPLATNQQHGSSPKSPTNRLLSGNLKIEIPKKSRFAKDATIVVIDKPTASAATIPMTTVPMTTTGSHDNPEAYTSPLSGLSDLMTPTMGLSGLLSADDMNFTSLLLRQLASSPGILSAALQKAGIGPNFEMYDLETPQIRDPQT